MPQAIKTAIYTKLTADQTAGTLYAAVGGRIFENEGQDDSALPLLVYEVTSSATSNVMTGDKEIVQAVATFTLYGHKRLGSAALGSIEGKLYSLLNGISMTTTGYDRGVVLATSRDIRQNFEDVLSSQSVYRIEATST